MSRKWERMVEKNKKQVNRLRTKTGKKPVLKTNPDELHKFVGRSWFFPLMLVTFALFFGAAFSVIYQGDWLFWATVISYVGLALVTFFFKRPFLKIGKDSVTTRKYSGTKRLEANSIEQITFMDGYIIIQGTQKKSKWMLSRLMYRYPLEEMKPVLRQFAKDHSIRLEEQTS